MIRGLAAEGASFVEGGAVTDACTGTGSTAVALVVAGEIWISDSDANSEVAEEAEYDDRAPEPGI